MQFVLPLTSTNARALQRAIKLIEPAACVILQHFLYPTLTNVTNNVNPIITFQSMKCECEEASLTFFVTIYFSYAYSSDDEVVI